jgi:hypothetical protein
LKKAITRYNKLEDSDILQRNSDQTIGSIESREIDEQTITSLALK